MSTHRVTITVPDLECPDDIEWTVEHLEDTPRCGVWYPCEKCSPWEQAKLAARADARSHDEVVYHGEEHQYIECEWMTRSTQCGLRDTDYTCEWVDAIYREHGPGTYPVEAEYDGDGVWFGVTPIEKGMNR